MGQRVGDSDPAGGGYGASDGYMSQKQLLSFVAIAKCSPLGTVTS